MLQVETNPKVHNSEQRIPNLPTVVLQFPGTSGNLGSKRKETQALRESWKKQVMNSSRDIQVNGSRSLHSSHVVKMPYLPDRSKSLVIELNSKKNKMAAKRDREISSAKYYTALTRRKREKDPPPKVKALTDQNLPLPRLFEDADAIRVTPRKPSVKEWENEIKKDVPPRPKYAYEPNWPPPKSPEKKEFYIKTNFPVFSKADRFAAQKRDFTVNPEWFSERIKKPLGFRYKTTVLRYGWIDRSVVL